MAEIPIQFGEFDAAADYVLRPGGYCVVRTSEGQIAIVRASGCFYLPGGGQEHRETPEQAAAREVLEECGLQVRITERIGVADELVYAAAERTHFRKRCTFFRAELLSEGTASREPDHQLSWVDMKQAMSLLAHASQKWAVAKVLESLSAG